jgi:hypothetical protein
MQSYQVIYENFQTDLVDIYGSTIRKFEKKNLHRSIDCCWKVWQEYNTRFYKPKQKQNIINMGAGKLPLWVTRWFSSTICQRFLQQRANDSLPVHSVLFTDEICSGIRKWIFIPNTRGQRKICMMLFNLDNSKSLVAICGQELSEMFGRASQFASNANWHFLETNLPVFQITF